MQNTKPMQTANEEWGFWGTSIRNEYNAEMAWGATSEFLIAKFSLSAELARDVLDSRFGRHLADELSFIKGGPITAEAIKTHLAGLIAEKNWCKYFERAIKETKDFK